MSIDNGDHHGAPRPAPGTPRDLVPFRTAVRAWFAISWQTFGGPAGQIAVMQRTLVDEKRWIGQGRFLHALNYCMLLPGPEAQQLAVYTGWLLNGWRGGLVAGSLFVLPGVLALLLLLPVPAAQAMPIDGGSADGSIAVPKFGGVGRHLSGPIGGVYARPTIAACPSLDIHSTRARPIRRP
jgi:hypothetical protein